MGNTKLVAVGGVTNALDFASADEGSAADASLAIPSQARTDKQKAGMVTRDVSGGASVTLTAAEAVNKVFRPTGQNAAYTVTIPDDCLLIVDTTAGADASGNDATVQTAGGSSLTVSDGHGAVVLAVGGTAYKLDVSG